MRDHLIFLLLAGFWLAMNAWLWRAESDARSPAGSPIPWGPVWQRMLNASDNSTLDILSHGERVGVCRWSATILADAPASADAAEPEGMVTRVKGYTVDLDGEALLRESSGNLRYNLHLLLATNQSWRECYARLNLRPASVELNASAATEQVHLRTTDGGAATEYAFTFAELRDPAPLLQRLNLPPGFSLLPMLALAGAPGAAAAPEGSRAPTTQAPLAGLAQSLAWDARMDTLKIGATAIRTYRLHARFLDRYDAVAHISRAGEILRVELPDEMVLVNQVLSAH